MKYVQNPSQNLPTSENTKCFFTKVSILLNLSLFLYFICLTVDLVTKLILVLKPVTTEIGGCVAAKVRMAKTS